ncbi:MAG: PQQ-dependent sugar dehydrogenase [Gammaproteobacteria bacterium]|nr:PQQ-dependent sugar dehydrogenase [Gammaproteobacteria bacterium]
MYCSGLVVALMVFSLAVPKTDVFASEVNTQYSVDPNSPFTADLGVRLPDGFKATVYADIEGYGRHLAVRDDGTLYFALTVRLGRGSNMGIVAMRDTDNDGVADDIERFATDIPGTALEFHNDDLYYGSKTEIYRFSFNGGEMVPSTPPEVVVGGFPEQRLHEAKTFAIDDKNNIYVNVGAPSNACMEEFRTRGSPGQRPCPQTEWQSGVWKFDADGTNQDQKTNGSLYATGIRNAMAIKWNDEHKQVYFLTHGRDALFTLYPEYFSAEKSAEIPSEEMHVLKEGGDYGWPFSYFDHQQNKRILAPEYGGDGNESVAVGLYEKPIAAFPGHWAPNDMMFYTGSQFPSRYQDGAFIVFHGSWNRAPLPQRGYKVIFIPFNEDLPDSDWEVFADGFTGTDVLESPGDAVHRPTGIAQGPNGELYISSTVSGRVWRINYTGE